MSQTAYQLMPGKTDSEKGSVPTILIKLNLERDPVQDGIAVIQTLIDAGADVNIKDQNGYTPLDYAFLLLKINQKLCNTKVKDFSDLSSKDIICKQEALRKGIHLLKKYGAIQNKTL